MAEAGKQPGATFAERYVEADGVTIRYLEAGQGPALIHLPGASEVRLSRAHDLLAERFRVIAVEVPGIDGSPADQRTAFTSKHMAHIATALGVERFALMGTAGGTALALRLALEHADRVEALVLESPTAPPLAPDLQGRLPALATATLVLIGTRDRAALPDVGRHYREALPNGHLVYVYDATHEIGADRPEAFTDLVSDFLVRREQFVVSRASSLLYP